MSGADGRSWLEPCAEFCRAEGLEPSLLRLLDGFRAPDPRGGPPPPPEPRARGDFAALEAELLAEPVFEGLAGQLVGVDAKQAAMFARRLRSLDEAFAEAPEDAGARLLRVGFRQRLRGIVGAPGPRALRLRALGDFYYSHLARHRHRRRDLPSVVERARALAFEAVAPGLEHARVAQACAEGPVHLNVLRVDPRRVRLAVDDCREGVRAGQPFTEWTRERGATAAVSGGFFLYSEPDIEAPSARYDPVGLLLGEGRCLSPPVFARGALLLDAEGGVAIEPLGLGGTCLRLADGRPLDAAEAARWNRSRARIGPDAPSLAIVGRRVVAVGRRLPVPLNGFVVPTPETVEVGTEVAYEPLRGSGGRPLVAGIAGGPMLLEGGALTLDLRREDFWGSAPPVTFSQDETGDQNLLPRLAVGLDHAQRLVFVAVDGRDFGRALGMTLGGVGEVLQALGCHTATNLDGGASKRMVLRGRALDLSSTELQGSGGATAGRVRPVHSAISMFAAG